MAPTKVLFVTAALLSLALAGCTAEEDGGEFGFVVDKTPSDPVTEAYKFRATVSGDSYEWDMGDGRAKQTGKTVEYVYGFTDGVVKPKLTVMNGEEKVTYKAKSLTLGTGQNQEPSLALSVEWNWVTVGEQVTFSGAGSTDPDGDPILFQWFCLRQDDIQAKSNSHAHSGGSGVGFGSAGIESVAASLLNGTSTETPDLDAGDDLCAAMNGLGSGFSETGTIRGAFAETGIYKVTMLAKDPKTPSLPGSVIMYVTGADEPRIQEPVVIPFDGSFDYGVPANLDGTMGATVGQDAYIAEHPFDVKYPMTAFALDFNYAAGGGTNLVTYHIVKPDGNTKDTAESSEDINRDDSYLVESPTPHKLRVYGRQGQDLSYDGSITITYEKDPSKLFEAATAH